MLEELMESHEQMSSFNKIAEEHSLPPKTEFMLYDKQGLGSEFNIFHDAYTYKEVLLALGNSTDIEWNIVEEVVGLLSPINNKVAMLSSSKRPTINLLVELVLQVKDVMSNASPILSSNKTAINKSVAKLEEYLANCDEIVHFASLLDPQLKSRFLEHCNGKGGMPDKNEILRRFLSSYQNESIEISNNPIHSEHELELKKYLESNSVNETDEENFDVLGWWESNESEYPVLSRMARDILATPITCSLTSGTEPLEEILDEIDSSRISIEMSEVLVCCNNWLRSNCNYGNFQARTSEEKGQIKMSARRENGNDLCAIVKSENADPKHHLHKARCSNYEDVRVAQGNNFTIAPKECRELLVNMIISSKASFTLLESSSFIEWARDLQPMYDRNIVSIERDLVGFYQIDRGMLSSFHDKNLSRISLSVFCLHKRVNVTAHYIDSDFNLVTIIIGMRDVYYGHTWPIVEAQLERCMQSRGLEKQVLALTSEKLPINTWSGLNCSVEKISLQCSFIELFCDLSNIIKDFFDIEDIEDYFLEEMIEFVGGNPNVMQIFNELALEYEIPPKLDFQFNYDQGWNSDFDRLQDVLPYRDVFNALTCKNVFPPEVETISCERWDYLKCYIKLYKPIYKAAIALASFKYPTSHLFLRIVFEIHDVISYSYNDFRMNNDHDKVLLLDELLADIDNYLKKCHKILLIASILDPQFKFAYLKRCYKKKIIEEEEVDEYILNLYNKYKIEDDKEDSRMSDEEDSGMSDEEDSEMPELKRYKKEDCVEIKDGADFDILKRWKDNQSTYPILSRIARDILAIPVCSAPWELLYRMPKWYKKPRFAKSARLLDDCILDVRECSNDKLFAARTNNELVQGTSQVKKAAIDYEKNIPQSERCVQQLWYMYSISYVERSQMK